MKILYIYRNPKMGISIGKVYKQIESMMSSYCEVDSIIMPMDNYSPSSLIRNIRYTVNYLKIHKYDIVHITGAEHYLIPFIPKKNLVVTVHDFGFYTQKKKSLKLYLKSILWIKSLRMVQKVICISNKTLREAEALVNLKKDQGVVIYDPVGHEYVPTEKESDWKYPVFLQVGTRPHKNLENTIKALEGFPCHLRIIGSLSIEQKDMLNKCRIDYSNACNLTDEEICEEYKKCDIVNFISMHEGFGMIIVEGQAIGRVVVTSDIEPMPEVAGESAIIVDPYSVEDIRKGYNQAIREHDKYVKLGFENIKRFTLEKCVSDLLEIYRSIIK